jgi:tadG
MKKKFKLTRVLLKSINQFNQDEQGVYAVMTALLAFPLLFLIAFTVDGTGALLDRTRLAQATDQATLLLITEDNKNRDRKKDGDKHKDLITQDVSKEREEAEKNGSPFDTLDAQIKKRNQQLVQGLVKLYLRSDDSLASKNSSPVTIPNDFLAECRENTNDSLNGKSKDVACTVQGTVHRKFILPWSHSLVTPDQLKDGRLAVNSGQAYAIKERQISIPIDLMMVTDFSRSMRWPIKTESPNPPEVSPPNRRIDALREVVTKIENILLPKEKKENVSPYNRIGFVSFAGGARQRDDTKDCVLPYYVHSKKDEISSLLKGGLNKITKGLRMLENHMDVKKTIAQITQFNDGKRQTYDFALDSSYSEMVCLENNIGKKTTQGWFDKNNPNVANELSKLEPLGGTAVTAGIFIGVNLLTETNKDPNAAPSKLSTNTRRVLLVLSDGEDNMPSKNTLINLMKNGLCEKTKEKINSLQDPNYTKVETRIAFIALGFNPPADQKEVWKKCVGEHYYPVFDREALFDAFKQIISFEEEVGRSSSKKPKLFQ